MTKTKLLLATVAGALALTGCATTGKDLKKGKKKGKDGKAEDVEKHRMETK